MKKLLVTGAVGLLLSGCAVSDSDADNTVQAPTVATTQLTNLQILQLGNGFELRFGCFGTTGVYLYNSGNPPVLKDKDEHCPEG